MAGSELAIVVSTLNERDNVGPLIDRLDRLLGGFDWEAVFVDDASADDTAEHLRDLGRTDRRIRCTRRFGRRGLSSACIEGILATSARYIAVIDANLQHDETSLPRMLAAVSALSSTSWAAASLIVMTRMSFFAGHAGAVVGVLLNYALRCLLGVGVRRKGCTSHFRDDARLRHRGAFLRARETAMFKAEARWLRCALDAFPPERLSPLLNLGSSSVEVREGIQPWIEDQVFLPLRARNVEVVHVDMRELPGVDVQADLTDPVDLRRLRSLRPRALLCCNLLEHVIEPDRLARHCLELVAAGGLLFVTVPFSYPCHRDPIDTMYRPNPAELAELLCGARLLDSTILGTGVSYRDAVRERPWLLLRHLWRLPIPFLSFEKWKRSMARLYWLAAEYRITCAVFEKL